MKFYIASRLMNHEQVSRLAKLLKSSGWTHTYDWTDYLSLNEIDIEKLRDIAEHEYEGVKQADIVIVLTPQGKGTHTELGMAIALNKTIYICHEDDRYFKCDDNTSAFYWLPQVKHIVGNTEGIASELIKLH